MARVLVSGGLSPGTQEEQQKATMSKAAAHRKSTKSGIDIDEARRKREDNIIELRKNKRDENLQKKRQTFAAPNNTKEGASAARKAQAKAKGYQRVTPRPAHSALPRSAR